VVARARTVGSVVSLRGAASVVSGGAPAASANV